MLIFKARRKDPTISHVLTASERRVMKILGTAMQKVRAGTAANEDQIIDALRHLPVGKVVDLVPDQPWFDAQGEIEDELFKELVASGQRTGSSLPKIQKQVLSYRFDADRPEAAAWAKKESAQLVTEIIEDQRNTIRDFVSASQMGEFTMTQVARNLRDVVGLTTQQTGWVDNFRNRAISDRMALGDSFEQASARAASSVERYQQRIHRYRSETIARTEILRANTEGRNQAWQQGIEEGFINAGASKQWSTEIDGRECEICASLDGEIVLISAEFSEGDPPVHPNCRCDVLLVDFADEDLEGLTSEQLDSMIDDLLGEQEESVPQGMETLVSEEEFLQGLNNEQKDEYYTARLLGQSDEEARAFISRNIADEMIPVNKLTPEEFDDELGQMIQNKNSYVGGGDATGYAIQKATGYDALPVVASKYQIDNLVNKGWTESFRGVTSSSNMPAKDIYKTFKEGELFPGRGIFGNGTYTASDKMVSLKIYADGPDAVARGEGAVWRMAISPDARVVKYSELKNNEIPITPIKSGIGGVDESIFMTEIRYDEGYKAIREGYDIIHVEASKDTADSDYFIILNRGVVAVQDTLEG